MSVIQPVTPESLHEAALLLCAGQLVAFPTETVYGLGADAANPQAVARIFAAKGRPQDHPVIVHVRDGADVSRWASDVPPSALRLIEHFWPGPLTLILRRADGVPDAVTGGQDTVGLRCPDHPVAQALLAAFAEAEGSGALAAPSANRFGRISPTLARHVAEEFGDQVPLVLDGGKCQVGIESTILDLSRGMPMLLRPGHIGPAALARVLGEAVWLPDGTRIESDGVVHVPEAGRAPASAKPRVSGDMIAHYAPHTPMTLVDGERLNEAAQAMARAPGRVGVWSRVAPPAQPGVLWRQAPESADVYAHELYALLREFDASGLTHILIEAPPHSQAWAAVRDRLGRAVAGSGKS